MYTLKSISEILDADLLDADNKENNIINDFEYQMLHVKSTQTAFISISKTSWQNYLNKSKVMNDGNSQIPKDVKEIGLIITESYVEGLAKKISFYNNLRHSSSTYAMIEGLNYLGEGVTVAEKAIDYIINNYLFEQSGVGHIFDDTKNINEIKLGQNAAFIFAVCEYLQIKPDHPEYLAAAQKVAEGILTMIDSETAQTVHVLNYPTLEVKEKFRVIYYDGEAALALLRLYQIDKNPRWLETVKAMFERFIHLKYWQYHDHWLGYCTNELIQIAPEQKYIEFGIRNVSSYLDYIKNRITIFPTFMEMLMATYHIIAKAREKGFGKVVDKLINVDELIDTIHTRANYQRTGYFYPELAIYFKNPERILGSFFIKHHGYRVRIDDIEHYVSGYVQYQQVFKEENNS